MVKIKKGRILKEYPSELITPDASEHRERERNEKELTRDYTVILGNALVIADTYFGSLVHFADHSCNANAVLVVE